MCELKKPNRKYLLGILVILVLGSFICGIAVDQALLDFYEKQARQRQPQGVLGVLTWRLFDSSGIHEVIHHNVKTLIADRYERNILGFDNVTGHNATKWMSLGNCTPANTLTKITTEATTGNLSRRLSHSIVSWMNGTHRAVNFTCEWTGTLNYVSVTSIGLHWNPTGDLNLYAVTWCTDGTPQQFGVATKATAIWTVTFF